jgi:hypothetical protein
MQSRAVRALSGWPLRAPPRCKPLLFGRAHDGDSPKASLSWNSRLGRNSWRCISAATSGKKHVRMSNWPRCLALPYPRRPDRCARGSRSRNRFCGDLSVVRIQHRCGPDRVHPGTVAIVTGSAPGAAAATAAFVLQPR